MTDYLDLSTSVSDAEYRRVLENLLVQFSDWRYQHGWCTDVYLFVGQLTRTYRWNREWERMDLDIPETRTGAERAHDLRELRGRILRFTITRPDYLDIAKANEFLTVAGLEPYVAETPPAETPRYGISASGYLTTADLTEAQIRDKIRRFMTRTLGISDPDVYVGLQAPRRSRRVSAVPESETVLLIENSALARNGYSAAL